MDLVAFFPSVILKANYGVFLFIIYIFYICKHEYSVYIIEG
jgi:hypothetical protein